jgi:hypothetical protein
MTVLFDFSDWSYTSLNEDTIAYMFGIPSGTLRIKAGNKNGGVQTGTISARLRDAGTCSVIKSQLMVHSNTLSCPRFWAGGSGYP